MSIAECRHFSALVIGVSNSCHGRRARCRGPWPCSPRSAGSSSLACVEDAAGVAMEMRYAMRPHDWASLAAIIAAVFFVSSVFLGQLLLASITGLIVVSGVLAARSLSRKYPGPMPYAMRCVLFLVPHAPRYLKRMLQPVAGERVLEIGPCLGHHALAIAPLLHPDGALHVLDLQQPMLNAIMRRTVAAGMTMSYPHGPKPRTSLLVTRLLTPRT